MKAGIYDPYLDTLGGGERYCLTIAEILLKNGWQVDLFWSGQQDLLQQAKNRFSLKIDKINFVDDIFHLKKVKIDPQEDLAQITTFLDHSRLPHHKISKIARNYQIMRQYDLIFYLSDGSVPLLFAKKNLFHVQVPFKLKLGRFQKLLNTFKLKISHPTIICNSSFTQKFTKQSLHHPSLVLYPPVDVDKFKTSKFKKNYILTVGRFDNILNAKKQDVLIKAFAALSPRHSDWSLILIGGSAQNPDQNQYLLHLKKIAANLPIKFIVNPPFSRLRKYYARSKIYWHAAGFNVNQDEHPEATEHFGMTVVEAMASALVPLVVNKGGLPEIVKHGQNGFHWSETGELIRQTEDLILRPEKLRQMAQTAKSDCQQFSKDNFAAKLLSIIKN